MEGLDEAPPALRKPDLPIRPRPPDLRKTKDPAKKRAKLDAYDVAIRAHEEKKREYDEVLFPAYKQAYQREYNKGEHRQRQRAPAKARREAHLAAIAAERAAERAALREEVERKQRDDAERKRVLRELEERCPSYTASWRFTGLEKPRRPRQPAPTPSADAEGNIQQAVRPQIVQPPVLPVTQLAPQQSRARVLTDTTATAAASLHEEYAAAVGLAPTACIRATRYWESCKCDKCLKRPRCVVCDKILDCKLMHLGNLKRNVIGAKTCGDFVCNRRYREDMLPAAE